MSIARQVTPIRLGVLMDFRMPPPSHWDCMRDILDALALTFAEAHESGQRDRPVELVVREVDGLPRGTVKAVIDAYAELVDEGCLAVFGPMVSDNTVPMREEIERRFRVPSISLCGSDEWHGEWTFSLSNGSLTDGGEGDYTYVFATNLATAMMGSSLVGYERNRLHRVVVMMGGGTGPTADATFDFVPDGAAAPFSRDIVTTDACKSCHGEEFRAHGGDRLSVENCATCHTTGAVDAQGGESLALEEMIHKIHAGGELPSVAGPDGNPWATGDNGEYAIWGYQTQRHSWEKVGFPAVIENCAKCHAGTDGDANNWMNRPFVIFPLSATL